MKKELATDAINLDRKALLDAINTIKPALANKDLIPELCHVWFDGKYALAYNDADLGMQIPCKTPFTGGIRGSLLIGLLQNSRARDVEIRPEKEEGFMMLIAAKMKARLAVLDIQNMMNIWQFPEPNIKKAFDLTEEFAAMMKAVLISVGNDTSIPEKMGVTVSLGSDMALYTTDSRSIAQGILDLPPGYKGKGDKTIILPTAFCEQLMRLCGKGGFLELREDCALAGNEDGVNIFCRLIESAKPLDFDGVVEKHSKAQPKGSKFPIPERLSLALDRAMVMLDGLPGEKITMTIDGTKLKLSASIQGRGDFNDNVDVPEGLPEVSFRIEPDLIKRALPLSTSMVCGEQAVYMTDGKGFRYLAATAGD